MRNAGNQEKNNTANNETKKKKKYSELNGIQAINQQPNRHSFPTCGHFQNRFNVRFPFFFSSSSTYPRNVIKYWNRAGVHGIHFFFNFEIVEFCYAFSFDSIL